MVYIMTLCTVKLKNTKRLCQLASRSSSSPFRHCRLHLLLNFTALFPSSFSAPLLPWSSFLQFSAHTLQLQTSLHSLPMILSRSLDFNMAEEFACDRFTDVATAGEGPPLRDRTERNFNFRDKKRRGENRYLRLLLLSCLGAHDSHCV